MKEQLRLEKNIVLLLMKIQQDFPELSKYIAEMPDKSLLSESSPTTYKPFKEYYISLINLVTKYAPTHMPKKITTNNLLLDKEGYPLYPASEDIYTVSKNETDLDPENIEILKSINNEDSLLNELDFKDDMSGDDLDIPGGELDDLEEQLGREDEENNYYSLGGDNHNDLEEDNG